MNIYVSGSLAYDRIMPFPGKFADHILPEKIHILNVCFLVDGLTEKFGGTAGNIAYNLSLLDEKPLILSCVGCDFGHYRDWLTKLDLPLRGLRQVEEEFTAGAYITTDQADNQITGFNPGAMKLTSDYSFGQEDSGPALAIISPGNVDDMLTYSHVYQERQIPYIFDPGQQIPVLGPGQLIELIAGAAMLISNDYELEMIMKATGLDQAGILERTGTVITTLGESGCRVVREGEVTEIGSARARQVKDPTGAGDSFRAGLIKGMVLGKPLTVAAAMGATIASFSVEHHGTQEHCCTTDEFWQRYSENFGSPGEAA